MEAVADVFLVGSQSGRSVTYTTLPGRVLSFRGGHARVFDEREMPWVLRRPDVEVTPSPRYLDFVPAWMNLCGESDPPRAQLSLPEGVEVAGTPTHYHLRVVEPGEAETETLADIGWDVADALTCVICGATFRSARALNSSISPPKCCSDECRAERQRQRDARRYQERKAARLAEVG